MKDLIFHPFLVIAFNSICVYLFIILAIRVFGKKELSQLSVTDLVFILLISNSVQNAMVGSNQTLEGGLVAATSLFLLNYLLKKLMYRYPSLSSMLQGHEIMLVYKGKLQEANLQRAEISRSELQAAAREHGIKEISDIDLAVLEVDGNISILSNDTKASVALAGFERHKRRSKNRTSQPKK